MAIGARVTKPRAFGDGDKDGSKAKQMVPFIAFVTQKKLRPEITRPTFLAANAVVLWVRPRPIFHFQVHWLRSLSPSPQHHSRCWSRRHSWKLQRNFSNGCCSNHLIGIVWIYLCWMKWFGAKFWFRGKWVILAPLFSGVGLPTWTKPAPIFFLPAKVVFCCWALCCGLFEYDP